MDLGRLRQEAMSDSFGSGLWRLSPEVRAERAAPHHNDRRMDSVARPLNRLI